MKESLNIVNITGVLVDNTLEVKNMGEENEAIAGELILRTLDGSEHSINYYANKYKKDENKKFTTEESKMYKSYETIMNEYISLKDCGEGEHADIIKIGIGNFTANDFKNKDGNIISNNKLSAKFANRLSEKEIETNPQTAKFEVSGIITKLSQETIKDVPTGNGIVMLDIIGYNGNLVPVKLVVPKDIVDAFSSAGFYEGQYSKFAGNIINTVSNETIVEKQAFGEDIVHEVNKTIKRYEITGGSPIGNLDELDMTDNDYETCKSKRRLKLEEIKNSNKSSNSQEGFKEVNNNSNPFGGNATQSSNPFGKPASNPFAQR